MIYFDLFKCKQTQCIALYVSPSEYAVWFIDHAATDTRDLR